MRKLKPTEQTAVMRGLGQQPVAWLLGQTARTVRDWSDIPRSPDGSFNAREVVAWFCKRQAQRVKLSEDDIELTFPI